MTRGSWFIQGMNIYETSTRLTRAGGWRVEVLDTKRSGPARICGEPHQGGCVPVPSAYFPFLPTKVFFKPAQFLRFTLHAVGGVRLL